MYVVSTYFIVGTIIVNSQQTIGYQKGNFYPSKQEIVTFTGIFKNTVSSCGYFQISYSVKKESFGAKGIRDSEGLNSHFLLNASL